nr:hypothetical protein [Candidatus Sigynarchaeota archaeon]
MDENMKITKLQKVIACPWCSTRSSLVWKDEYGEYCLSCKKNLKTGKNIEDGTARGATRGG